MAHILLADEEQWEASFVGAFAGVLSLNERLALPGRQCKLIWVTGDATPERVATVDWTHKRAATGDVQPFRAPLAAAIGEEDEDGVEVRLEGDVGARVDDAEHEEHELLADVAEVERDAAAEGHAHADGAEDLDAQLGREVAFAGGAEAGEGAKDLGFRI